MIQKLPQTNREEVFYFPKEFLIFVVDYNYRLVFRLL
jgi:hypothetical protein